MNRVSESRPHPVVDPADRRGSRGGPRRSGETRRPRVLMVSESVTLAQIVRLARLGQALGDDFEVHFASARFPDDVFDGLGFHKWRLHTLSAEEVDARIAAGRRLYDDETLERYLADDLKVIEGAAPDLVVGDLRWSLSVSAPLAGVPYAALANAYWSDKARLGRCPLPEHPLVRALGPRIAGACFPLAAPHVFSHFARPMNRLRRRYGLPSIGGLHEVVTHGDFTLFCDAPELVPTRALPAHQRFIGPVSWSAGGELPGQWGSNPARPAIYVTLGSSGDVTCLPVVLAALAGLDADVLLSTAGRVSESQLPRGIRLARFVPGDRAARRARLVITNGGSSSGYQALAEGTPVLGIPYNLDQYLATAAIERTGAGLGLRSGILRVRDVRAAVIRCLSDAQMKRRAQGLRKALGHYDSDRTFRQFVSSVVSGRATRGAV